MPSVPKLVKGGVGWTEYAEAAPYSKDDGEWDATAAGERGLPGGGEGRRE